MPATQRGRASFKKSNREIHIHKLLRHALWHHGIPAQGNNQALLYYIRPLYVQKARAEAAEKALAENLSKHQDFDHSVAVAREQGKAAARRASRQVKHVTGPMASAGWDLFETMYMGGSVGEAIVRSCGTFVGAYSGG
ncbi:UNVERIFIED_CONTAM: hypothetical protein Slati_0384500 [Sesamum latifolium]|uniref:Uncharacterized protein n=1 Tax=Sesamum latifolium TaxID=2727402 RepID=A0AAW2XTZ4_9LAMI